MATVNENVNVKINIEGDGSMKSLRAMRLELRQLQEAMTLAGQVGDEKLFKKLQADFVQLRNDMRDTNQAMQYMDPGELLGGWIKMTQGVVGSFAAITGALNLFGVENEKLQAIEKKSMVLIQTMMGLEQMRQLLIDGGGRAQMKSLVQNTIEQYKQVAATVAATLAQKAQTASTIAGSIAFKGLGLAMKAVPFLAIAGAIVGVVMAISRMGKKSKEASEEVNYMTDTLKQAASGASDSLAKLDLYSHNLVKTKGNQKEFAKAINDYNTNIAAKFNTNLLTTASNLDDIARAANEARANIWNMALVEAGQAKMKQIWTDNFDALVEYNQAQQNAEALTKQLADAQQAFQNKWKGVKYDPWQDQRGKDQQAEYEVIATLTARIENLRLKGIDSANAAGQAQSDLFKQGLIAQGQIDSLLQTIDDASQKITVTVRGTGAAVKDVSKDITSLLAEGVDEQEELDLYLSEEAKKALAAKRLAEKEKARLQQEALDAELMRVQSAAEKEQKIKDGWFAQEILKREEHFDKRLEMLKDFHERGLITEKDYLATVADLIKQQTDKYAGYVNDIASQSSDIFSNLTEMAMMELEYQDKLYQDRYDAKNEGLTDSLEKAKEVWGEESKQYKALLEEQKKLDEEKAEHDKKIEADKKAAQNKYAKVQLAMQMAQATASFAQGIAGIWATELGTKGIVGAPIAIAMTALLSSVYATQMALMTKQMSMVGKMRKGGYISGASHEQGGVLRELEGGEAVVNKNSMSNPSYRNIVSAINVAGGGVPYPNTRGLGQSSALTASIDSSTIETIVESVTNRIAAIPVIVTESDITTTQRKVSVIKNRTTLG